MERNVFLGKGVFFFGLQCFEFGEDAEAYGIEVFGRVSAGFSFVVDEVFCRPCKSSGFLELCLECEYLYEEDACEEDADKQGNAQDEGGFFHKGEGLFFFFVFSFWRLLFIFFVVAVLLLSCVLLSGYQDGSELGEEKDEDEEENEPVPKGYFFVLGDEREEQSGRNKEDEADGEGGWRTRQGGDHAGEAEDEEGVEDVAAEDVADGQVSFSSPCSVEGDAHFGEAGPYGKKAYRDEAFWGLERSCEEGEGEDADLCAGVNAGDGECKDEPINGFFFCGRDGFSVYLCAF